MSNVYFVCMREMLDGYYDGYKDWRRLAELSGYEVIWLDEIDPASDNTYILSPLNGSWENGWEHPKARIILWDLEWRLEKGAHDWGTSLLKTPPGVSEVWASDKWYAGILQERATTPVKYVPLGSHPGLVEDNAPTVDPFDVTFQAYIWGRRNTMADTVMQQGLTIAPSRWNPDRDALLKNTAAMLHVHQWEKDGIIIKTVAPLRFAIAAAYGLPLISEQVQNRDMFDGVVLFSDYDAMPAYANTLVRRYQAELQERGQALHELLCVENSFRSFVEAAL